VIAAGQVDKGRVFDFEENKEKENFDGVYATIDVVTDEYVVVVRGVGTLGKKLEKVLELTVDVTNEGYWGF